MIRLPMIRLVAEREMRARAGTRAYRWTTAVLLLASLAAVTLPVLLGGDGPERQTVAVAGGPVSLPEALVATAQARGDELSVREEGAAEAAQAARSGEVDAAVIDRGGNAPLTVVVDEELPDGLRATILQAAAAARVGAALADAGVPPARIAELNRPPAVAVEAADPVEYEDADLGVGFIVAVLLYLTLIISGAIVAAGVAEEKTSRVSEVLLASLRPTELLIGKVAGIGLITLAQLAAAAIPALLAALALDVAELPDATGAVVAWGLVWFVVGYLMYSAAYGALGALVGRQQEVGQVTAIPAGLLLLGYLGSTFLPGDPDATWVQVGSILPPFAPMMMPMRVAAGGVPAAEMALALALAAATAVAATLFGARVYRAGITRTGPRVRLRDALAGASGRRSPASTA